MVSKEKNFDDITNRYIEELMNINFIIDYYESLNEIEGGKFNKESFISYNNYLLIHFLLPKLRNFTDQNNKTISLLDFLAEAELRLWDKNKQHPRNIPYFIRNQIKIILDKLLGKNIEKNDFNDFTKMIQLSKNLSEELKNIDTKYKNTTNNYYLHTNAEKILDNKPQIDIRALLQDIKNIVRLFQELISCSQNPVIFNHSIDHNIKITISPK